MWFGKDTLLTRGGYLFFFVLGVAVVNNGALFSKIGATSQSFSLLFAGSSELDEGGLVLSLLMVL